MVLKHGTVGEEIVKISVYRRLITVLNKLLLSFFQLKCICYVLFKIIKHPIKTHRNGNNIHANAIECLLLGALLP